VSHWDDHWVDRVAVARLLIGEPVGRPATWAEKVHATAHLLDHGGAVNDVTGRLHVSGSVARDLIGAAQRLTRTLEVT